MTLSPAFKQAFKIGLAMVISYAIALSMDWEKPLWAGLAVAVGSLATTGDTINNGLQRVIGTIFAGAVAITITALFPQERWVFLFAMSVFIAYCNYKLFCNRALFSFWLTSGFTVPLVAFIGDQISITTFQIIIERTQETALGLLVYSIVAVLIWPQRSDKDFKSAVRTFVKLEAELFVLLSRSLRNLPVSGDKQGLRDRLRQESATLYGKLDAAVFDSDEIFLSRAGWRRSIGQLTSILTAMEQWYLCLRDLDGVEIERAIPGIEAFCVDLQDRLSMIEEGIERGSIPDTTDERQPLAIDREALREFPHFTRAAIILCFDELVKIGRQLDALTKTVAEINGLEPVRQEYPSHVTGFSFWVPDVDAIAETMRQTAALWVLLLMAIYLPEFGSTYIGLIAITNGFAMALSTVPHAPPWILYKPALFGTALAGLLYVFVMPALSGFWQLSVMIFLTTFLIAYIFHEPRFALARTLGLVMFTVVTGITNEQTYSFLYPANWFLAMVMFCVILTITRYVPISFRPERRFVAMLERFLSSAKFLLSNTTVGKSHAANGPIHRWLRDYQRYQMAVLPQRLRPWMQRLPAGALSVNRHTDFNSLLNEAEALGNWVSTVLRLEFRAPERLPPDLVEDISEWKSALTGAIGLLGGSRETIDASKWRAKVDSKLAQIEARVEELLNEADYNTLPAEMRVVLYQHLGEYRGLSEAVIGLASAAEKINWALMKESRF